MSSLATGAEEDGRHWEISPEGEVLECTHAIKGDELEGTGAMSSLATGADEDGRH
jgi:hypothetical protein